MGESIDRVVGFDIGDRRIEVCVIAADDGRVLRREKLVTQRAAVEAWLARELPARVVMETGTHAPWIVRAARAAGHEGIVVDARRVKLITQSSRKTDRRDAHMLARIGRSELDLARPVHVRSQRTQQVRGMLRMRDALVGSRSKQINTLRGVTKSDGLRLPSCSAEAFPRQAREAMPEPMRAMARPLLESIEQLTDAIRQYDRDLERIARQEHAQATERLEQVAGVGTLTALAVVLAVEDPARFKDGRQMAAYLGLVPRLAQSGQQDPRMGISKEGDRYARRLLVSAAHYVLERGPDTDLRRWGRALETRWGPKTRKRAAVAVARKLAVLLHRLWIGGVTYEPLRHAAKAA
jgi:transposase